VEDKMTKFIVTKIEKYEQFVEVEADSEDEAISKVNQGEGDYLDQPIYHSDASFDSWSVEVA
jgi:hypothetical protein